MLLSLIVQSFFMFHFFKIKELKNKKTIYFVSIWMTILVILVFWRVFNLSYFNKDTLVFLSITQYRLNSVLTVLGSLLVYNFLEIYVWFSRFRIFEIQYIKKWKKTLFLIVLIVPVVFGLLLMFSSHWAMQTFDNLTFDQIIYMLSESLKGTDPNQIYAYIYSPVLNTLFISSIVFIFLYFNLTYRIRITTKVGRGTKYMILLAASVSILFISSGIGIHKIGYADIKSYYFEQTEIYENHYVDAKQAEIRFPEKKRNLVYIFLESMESSYASKEYGGAKNQNLIPNLMNLALNEGVHFSNTDRLGGFLPSPGTGATASSMVAQTSGVPLLASSGKMSTNDYGDQGHDFLPGAYSLGEILKEEGYQQMLFIGSEASFAGRDKYFAQHGDYQIRDYDWAKENKLISQDYRVWWGYEDRKLFEFAKESLTELSEQPEPFNFTMLTTDTHFEDGYMTEETPKIFDDQYSNVIYDNDRRIVEFVDWIKQQPFYENTTVILVGDHLTMDVDFFSDVEGDYQRSVYNVFLNIPEALTSSNTQNRIVTTVDLFPTTLAALGAEISSNRLGLGTNLFSERQTLSEELGYEAYLEELKKKSFFYSQKIMQGTDDKLYYEKK